MAAGKGRKGQPQGKGIRRPPAEPTRRQASVASGEEAHIDWSRKNFLLIGAGGVAILLGFVLLAVGDITVAPILLVGGYLVLIPWGIIAKTPRNGAASGRPTSEPTD